MFLDDDQLNSFRADVVNMLPGTAILSASTVVSDGAGGWTDSYVPISGGTVACRVDPLRQRGTRIEVQVGRETLEETYQFTVPWDAPLTGVNMRVEVAGRTYEVIQLEAYHSWNVSRRGVISIVR